MTTNSRRFQITWPMRIGGQIRKSSMRVQPESSANYNCLFFLDVGHMPAENFNKIALSRTVKETEANLCFSIFGKNLRKRGKILKIAKSTLLKYPVGRKFQQNRSISQG